MSVSDIIEKSVNACFAAWPQTPPTSAQAAKTKLIAHRGAHDHRQGIIENTLAAFQRASRLGCYGSELDVHLTKDNVLVVHHDLNLQRLHHHKTAIKEVDLKSLKQLAPTIPTLPEVVQAVASQQVLFIELKTPILNETPLLAALDGLKAGKDYFLISLEATILAPLKGFPKHSQLLVATQYNTKQFCQATVDQGYAGVMGHYLLLHQARIKQLHQASKRYGVGFVDSKNSLYREINRGIPWLFTNQAASVSRHLTALL